MVMSLVTVTAPGLETPRSGKCALTLVDLAFQLTEGPCCIESWTNLDHLGAHVLHIICLKTQDTTHLYSCGEKNLDWQKRVWVLKKAVEVEEVSGPFLSGKSYHLIASLNRYAGQMACESPVAKCRRSIARYLVEKCCLWILLFASYRILPS